MDWILTCKALILGVVEGLTEFLPVSSTGHLIIAGHLLKFNAPQAKTFDVVIQLGAILAVCWEFRQRIVNVVVGLPVRAVGVLEMPLSALVGERMKLFPASGEINRKLATDAKSILARSSTCSKTLRQGYTGSKGPWS